MFTCKNTPLVFRSSKTMSKGTISLKNVIGLNDVPNGRIHKELTSRSIHDGETFKLIGHTQKLGVGLCIETCILEQIFQPRFYHKCLSFFGTETTMRVTDEEGIEDEVPIDRDPSRRQGFTYNKHENCVTHIGDTSHTCIQLPKWFKNKNLRAFGFVWNSNYAQIDHTC